MKFLINENIGQSVIQFLDDKQFDNLVVSKDYHGKEDLFLIKKTYEENRIIITNDKDFGFLVFRSGNPIVG